jgi:TonB family protein
MGALPTTEPAALRYAAYIEELHEFLATSGVRFGTPQDLVALVPRLSNANPFSDDLSSLVRSFVLRQGGAMPHAVLVEILAAAIAGPGIVHAPQESAEPLRQLLKFVAGVMRRPWNVPPGEQAEVVAFPAPAPEQASTATANPTGTLRRSNQPPSGWTLHLRRNLIAATAATALVAVALALYLRPRTSADVFRIQPAPAAVANAAPPRSARNPAYPPSQSITVAAASSSAIQQGQPIGPNPAQPSPAQPSPYGNTLIRRPSQVLTAPVAPAQQAVSIRPQPAVSSAPDEQPSSAPRAPAQVSPAPIIPRRPYNPDAMIAGDLPDAAVPASVAPHSYFTVASGIMASSLIYSPQPEYPRLARLSHVRGQVILQAVVARDGSVSTVRALRGNPLLRGAAENAVRQWRFRPYRLDGHAVDVATIITIGFDNRN